VNNVGTNHSIPTPFVEEDFSVIESIVNVNITSVLRITHMILPQMVERRKGLIVNVGSFAGMFPTPLLQTYAGSKSFLKHWSESLAAELKPSGVHVELLNTYFVVRLGFSCVYYSTVLFMDTFSFNISTQVIRHSSIIIHHSSIINHHSSFVMN
jgi:short-subunit dehydrogenase